MDEQKFTGTITFIHHEKKYATIEYQRNGKTKSINGDVSESSQQKLKEKKLIKKIHAFRIGDVVEFIVTNTPKGNKMIADQIEFRFNNAYSNLINKAAVENRFSGYLKKVEDDYFVKESGSYIIFPLILSPWETPPTTTQLNEVVFFKLNNTNKGTGVTASLFKSDFVPEYKTALKHYTAKKPVEAVVTKTSPFGIFITLFNKLQVKMPRSKIKDATTEMLKPGDRFPVIISYISPFKIVVEKLPSH